MRKKLLAGGLAALGCAVLGLGATGTYAAFVDTEQVPQTQLQAGTLDLRLSTEGTAESDPLELSGLVPGPSPQDGAAEHSYVVRLTNDGSLPGAALWGTTAVEERENGCNAAEQAARDRTCAETQGELGEQLEIALSVLSGADCSGDGGVLGPGPFSPISSIGFRPVVPGGAGDPLVLAPGESRCARVDVYFPHGENNNVAQGDSSTFRLAFRLDQTP
jgi:predicted ribosomally synthesized peptide with SipW-like signal peptide